MVQLGHSRTLIRNNQANKLRMCFVVIVICCINWVMRQERPKLFYRIARSTESPERTGDVAQTGRKHPSYQWLFQISTGRSGSSTIRSMLNELPGVYIAGENGGIFSSIFALHKSAVRTGFYHTESNSWYHKNISSSALEGIYREYMEEAIGLPSLDYTPTIVGFKEIRYESPKELDYLAALFPNGKFVVNVRRDVEAQQESRKKNLKHQPVSSASEIEKRNDWLTGWADAHGDRTFQLALEDLDVANMNRLAEWLGFSNCRYNAIRHLNINGFGGKAIKQIMNCTTEVEP